MEEFRKKYGLSGNPQKEVEEVDRESLPDYSHLLRQNTNTLRQKLLKEDLDSLEGKQEKDSNGSMDSVDKLWNQLA